MARAPRPRRPHALARRLTAIDLLAGVRLPAAAVLAPESLPADDKQRAVMMSYKKEYEARFKQDISTFGGHA